MTCSVQGMVRSFFRIQIIIFKERGKPHEWLRKRVAG